MAPANSSTTLLVKWVREWRPAQYDILDSVAAARDQPRPYPLDWRGKASPYRDADGVTIVKGSIGWYRNPVAMSFGILADHQSMNLNGGRDSLVRSIVANAQALLNLQLSDGSWRYPCPVARYGRTPGWASGMAQGLAASALLRSQQYLHSDVKERVESALRFLQRDVAEGGCSSYDHTGRAFFEECPGAAGSIPYILNGALFATISCFDVAESLSLPEWRALAAAAGDRLADELHMWDINYWSRYDLISVEPASPSYHRLHVALLDTLGHHYPRPEFRHTAERWRRWDGDLRHRSRALLKLARLRTRGGVP